MFCLFGKMYLQVGQYEKGRIQFLSALVIWEGKSGWRSLAKGNESGRGAHDVMIGKGLELCDAGEFRMVETGNPGQALTTYDLFQGLEEDWIAEDNV